MIICKVCQQEYTKTEWCPVCMTRNIVLTSSAYYLGFTFEGLAWMEYLKSVEVNYSIYPSCFIDIAS